MKVFISQPMRDRTKEEILKEREEIITKTRKGNYKFNNRVYKR